MRKGQGLSRGREEAMDKGREPCRSSRILLHVCCAPCATWPVERLSREGFEAVLFFSNSNVHPEEEYTRRLDEARRLAGILGLELVEDVYDHEAWLDAVRGLEAEPERGKRCMKCFAYNLGRAALAMERLGLSRFTTTLTVSRHKSSRDVFAAARTMPGFLAVDFKKQDGYHQSVVLSRELKLYRQGYCGCEFSRQAALRDSPASGKT